MPTFQYKAIDSKGQRHEGQIDAASQSDLMIELDKKGWTVLDIKNVNQLKMLLTSKKVSKKELAIFTKQLSYLLGTGIALHRGIEIIAEQIKNKFFVSILVEVIKDIKQGVTISQAISKHPNVFPEAMIFQMKAAEEGGFMQEALSNMSLNFERDAKFVSQVRGAMIYPAVVMIVAIGIVYFMLATVVPSMAKTLMGFDTEMPGITVMVMSMSEFVQSYWLVIILGVAIIIYGSYVALKNPDIRLKFDTFLTKMPILGKLVVSINIARMTRIMSSLLSSGVPIDDTLDNLSKVLTNKAMSAEIVKLKQDVIEQGLTLSKALEMRPIFPKIVVQVVSVGEESGNLSHVLVNLAESLEEEVTNLLKTTTSLINPLLMVGIGIVIAVIVMALFMPLFSLMDAF